MIGLTNLTYEERLYDFLNGIASDSSVSILLYRGFLTEKDGKIVLTDSGRKMINIREDQYEK
jgi:hypothetical protein